MRRPRGRPASKKDKNGLPVPVRADRDPAIQLFIENVSPANFDVALQVSGNERFHRLHDALHDPVVSKDVLRDVVSPIRGIKVTLRQNHG